MKVLDTLEELQALVGQEVALSDWITITQEQVIQFAHATGDYQWIHVDVQRAQQGPFGAPIAHGFLTLSLLPKLMESALRVRAVRMGVNYGLNRVRFISPVPVGSRVRARLRLLAGEAIEDKGVALTWQATIELEGAARPACVAEMMVRLYP